MLFRIRREDRLSPPLSALSIAPCVFEQTVLHLSIVLSLNEYGEISGYFTNETKSIAVMLPGECLSELEEKIALFKQLYEEFYI